MEEVLVLQEIFKFAINLCLDKENLPQRHVSEKLIGFLFQYNQFNHFVIKNGYALMPHKNGKRCSEIGRTNTYKNSLGEEKSPLKIAQTLYNKLYSRMDRARNKLPDELTEKDLTEEAFFKWSKKYSAAKEDFKNGRISGEQLLDIIKYD